MVGWPMIQCTMPVAVRWWLVLRPRWRSIMVHVNDHHQLMVADNGYHQPWQWVGKHKMLGLGTVVDEMWSYPSMIRQSSPSRMIIFHRWNAAPAYLAADAEDIGRKESIPWVVEWTMVVQPSAPNKPWLATNSPYSGFKPGCQWLLEQMIVHVNHHHYSYEASLWVGWTHQCWWIPNWWCLEQVFQRPEPACFAAPNQHQPTYSETGIASTLQSFTLVLQFHLKNIKTAISSGDSYWRFSGFCGIHQLSATMNYKSRLKFINRYSVLWYSLLEGLKAYKVMPIISW